MSTLESTQREVFGTDDRRSSLDFGLIIGVALVALGAGMFGLGIFHGFEHGSCSTTGYSANYGPVPQCSKGVGWWMGTLMCGLLVAGGGAVLARRMVSLISPVLFVAIGTPFMVLALGSGSTHLVLNTSASTGKIFSGIFGACFVGAGVLWGVIAGRSVLARLPGSSRVGALLSAVVGVAAAFAIAAGVSGAVGSTTATALGQSSPATTQGAGAGGTSGSTDQVNSTANQTSRAATRADTAAASRANAAIKRATTQAKQLTKLAACVSSAGTDAARIQRCEAKYMG